MYDNNNYNGPSTSSSLAVDDDTTKFEDSKKYCCKSCSFSDIEVIHPQKEDSEITLFNMENSHEQKRQTLPPDRQNYYPSKNIMFSSIFLLIVLFFNNFTVAFSSPSPLTPLPRIMVREFDDNGIGSIPFSPMHEGKKVQLQKMVYDDNTNRLIVGAVNHLYDVPTSLTETKEDVFLRDDCKGPNCDSNVYVKALAIDRIEHELIECSSVKRGVCRRRILGNISNIVEESNRKLVPSGSDGQVTAFVTMTCGSDVCENKELNKQTLFLGITPTIREDTQYLVAGYDLKKGDQLNLLSNAFQGLYLSFTNAKSQAVNQIDYVMAFDYEKYVYFVIRQNHANAPSKLARICKDDPTFYSYSEIPLNCKTPDGQILSYVQDAHVGNPQYYLAEEFHGSTIDNIQLIFAVFTDKFHHEFTDYATSGICVFNMEDVSRQFTNAHRHCNAGKGSRGFDYHPSGVKDCTLNALTNFECGNEVNPHVFGSGFPVDATTFIHREKEFFTSIYVHGVKGTNVGFIGTSTGALHKALIINSTASKIFKTVQLTDDGSPILQDKKFVLSHASSVNTPTLFLLSKYAVYKVKVDHCDRVDNCIDCVRQENPFCGWCLKSNTCSRDNECPEDVTLIDGFKQYITYQDSRSCPSILSISPNQQYIAVSRNLTISTQNIASSPYLECVFDIENVQRQRKKAENVTDGTFRCATPTFTSLVEAGVMESRSSSVQSILSIVDRQATLISTNFTFFDCQQHKTCHECASSQFPCDWCIKNDKCVANSEDVCLGDVMVVSKIKEQASRRGPESCPLFDHRNHSNFYIGLGKNRQISVIASNLDDATMQHFKCNYTYGGGFVKTVNAVRRRNNIECLEFKFDNFEGHSAGEPTLPIDLSILWAKEEKPRTSRPGSEFAHYRALDNPHKIKVIVYQCENLANNCGKCLTLSRDYECGWCEATNKCTFRATCAADFLTIVSPNVRCKNPQILDFWPRKGPLNGGTRLNITGVNLGLSASSVQVNVANQRCEVNQNEYRQAESIICTTGRVSTPQDGHVIVRINGGEKTADYAHAAVTEFRFINPELIKFRPPRGPVNGGTDIVISGHNLDSGRDAVVKIGTVNCRVRERTEHELICRTEKADYPGYKENIALTVDGAAFSLPSKISFEFKENPIVTRVERSASIVSGGILTEVYGKDFHLLQRPRMVAEYEDQLQYGSICAVRDGGMSMTCSTPKIDVNEHTRFSNEKPLLLRYGFSLDSDEKSYTEYFGEDEEDESNKLKVFPDPKILHFGKVQTAQAGADLVIKGENLTSAALVRDVRVRVGGTPCDVTALAEFTLTCQLSPMIDEVYADRDDLDVLVEIGNKVVNVGMVTADDGNSYNYLILAGTIAFISLSLLLFVFILYRRKNSSHNRQLRTLKHQMTSIEMKVAQECKEAFHELQTNLNAIAGSLPEGTSFIPFLSYHDYSARILFPHSFNNHPVLRDLEVDQERAHQVESGLKQLYALVQNRTFLLSFVRTIDENKYLLQKDRVYVGSLLMVILQERMDYCTDILKQLLKDLIKRNLEARFQPKILFRRAESVAERMLSVWFSFLMYRYLTGTAGEQLYQFYWATKQQTEKGPQDAITLEARYSLSEEKLLRSTVQCRELTIFVVSEGNGVICDTQVTVLDCDSITQVKEKCIDAKYRTIPFSGRPTVSDVDLEWRLQNGNRKLLLDLDQTSRHDNGFWKHNTLAHYKVDNKAMLALIPRQANSSSYNLSLLSDRSDKSSSSFNNSPTLTRPFGTHSSNGHSKDTMRVFHLVRQQVEHDTQEKMMSEIYLTRLLHMKGILQKFIENLFEVIFTTSNRSIRLPACVKYMFDFLDDQAREHNIVDEDVSHAWKSNALPLRFWVNLIKNPDFIFDIPKPTKIEGSLNVVAQTLMDACSTQELHLTKDSPSSKLLFANDIDKYKNTVHNFYEDVAKLPRIPEADMNSFLVQESQTHKRNFLLYSSALNELYVYVNSNRDMIIDELSKNDYACHEQLPARFQKMLETMDVVPDTNLINNGSLDNYNSKSRLMSGSNSRFY